MGGECFRISLVTERIACWDVFTLYVRRLAVGVILARQKETWAMCVHRPGRSVNKRGPFKCLHIVRRCYLSDAISSRFLRWNLFPGIMSACRIELSLSLSFLVAGLCDRLNIPGGLTLPSSKSRSTFYFKWFTFNKVFPMVVLQFNCTSVSSLTVVNVYICSNILLLD